MCGVPYHSAEAYIGRLIAKGYKVAICEQLEDPALAKGLVTRDVIRIITPGTVTESSLLEEGKSNYIAASASTGIPAQSASRTSPPERCASRLRGGGREPHPERARPLRPARGGAEPAAAESELAGS